MKKNCFFKNIPSWCIRTFQISLLFQFNHYLCFSNSISNSIQSLLSFLSQLSALFSFSNKLHLFQFLQSKTGNMSVTLSILTRSHTIVDTHRIDFSKSADTNCTFDIQLSGNGGSSVVEPVVVVGRQLLASVGFTVVGPFGGSHATLFFEEGAEGEDKVGLVDVFDTDHF